MAAYLLYAGRVPPLSMQCLVFMALVSKDADEQPWYGQGHEALAIHALGRPEPITESDEKAVQRAVRPLLADDVKAIEVDRRPAGRRDGPNTTRYRLHLYAGRKPSTVEGPNGGHIPSATVDGFRPQRWTHSVPNGGRKPSTRGIRGTTKSKREEQGVASAAQVQTARETDEPIQEIHLAGEKPSSDRGAACDCGTYLDPDGSCFACATPTPPPYRREEPPR